jgi:hypothetical protein
MEGEWKTRSTEERREKWQNEWPGRYLLVVVNEFVAYFNNWPQYIKVDQYVPGRTLRSSSQIQLEVPTESGTFQDSAAAAFNSLPDCLRNCKHFNIFRTSVKDYLTDQISPWEARAAGYKWLFCYICFVTVWMYCIDLFI